MGNLVARPSVPRQGTHPATISDMSMGIQQNSVPASSIASYHRVDTFSISDVDDAGHRKRNSLPAASTAISPLQLQNRAWKLLLWAFVCSVLCILAVCCSTVLCDSLSAQLKATVASDMVISSTDCPAFSPWANSSDPNAGLVISLYYVYDVLNPADVIAGGKPRVREIGPLNYVYNNMKYNVTWDADEDGDVLSYKQYQYYTEYDAATAALGSQVVTTLNLPLLSVLSDDIMADIIATTPELQKYINASYLFVQRPASEVLFGWANDPFLTDLNKYKPSIIPFSFPVDFSGIQNNDSSLTFALNTHSFNRMYTGKRNADMLMQLIAWDGSNNMLCCAFGPCGEYKIQQPLLDLIADYTTYGGERSAGDSDSGAAVQAPIMPWNSAGANAVSGSSGSQFQTDITPDSAIQQRIADDILRVETYDSGIFRHWDLLSAGDTYDVQDIEVLRFSLSPTSFANVTQDANMGYIYNSFGPSGIVNQSNCASGAPIFISKPRFLDGDTRLAAALENLLPPNREDHDTWIGVEPNTGSTLDFHWRVGVNAYVQPVPAVLAGTTFFAAVAPIVFPVAWASQDSVVSSSQADLFKEDLLRDVIAIRGVFWGGIALAIAAGCAAVALVTWSCCLRRKASHIELLTGHNHIAPASTSLNQGLLSEEQTFGLHAEPMF